MSIKKDGGKIHNDPNEIRNEEAKLKRRRGVI